MTAGFAVVRLLSVEEYARFSIALAVMTAAVTVADSGICNTLNARAAFAGSPAALGALMAAARRLALSRVAWVGAGAASACGALLLDGHAPAAFALGATGVTAAYIAVSMARMLWHVIARLRCSIAQVLSVDTAFECAKPVLIVSLVLAWPAAMVALLVPPVLAVGHWFAYRRLASPFVSQAPAASADHAVFRTTTRDVLPTSIFFALQGQIALWIIAALGTTGEVAALGAIGRFAVIYSLAAPFLANVVAPRIARISDTGHLRARVRQMLAAAVLVALVVTVASAVFADAALALLGPAYAGFALEFALVMAISGVGFVAGVLNAVNVSRAWYTHYWLAIPATLIGQAVVAALADLSTLSGAITLAGVSSLALLATYGFICARGVAQFAGSRSATPAPPA